MAKRIICPLLTGFEIGDRLYLGDRPGRLRLMDGPADGDVYTVVEFDDGGVTCFNQTAAARAKHTRGLRRGRSAKCDWLTTPKACDRLGVSRYTLANMRDDGTLTKGYHWKVINPNSAKLRYLWHCDRIEKLQGEVLTG